MLEYHCRLSKMPLLANQGSEGYFDRVKQETRNFRSATRRHGRRRTPCIAISSRAGARQRSGPLRLERIAAEAPKGKLHRVDGQESRRGCGFSRPALGSIAA